MNLNLNLKEFLKYLSRFRWVLILVPVLSAVISYLMVKKLPKVYKSSALIATGITNQPQQSALNTDNQLDYFKLSQQFGNLMEMMKSKKSINILSYKLILHDLKNPGEAFKKPPELLTKLSPQDKEIVINEYEKRLANGTLISIADNGNRIKLYDILKASGYSENILLRDLNIGRNGESDFIKVEFQSPNPNLSAYVVNMLSKDFIAYYTSLSVAGRAESLAILDSLLRAKEIDMQKKNAAAQNAITTAAAQAAGAANAQRRSDIASSKATEAESQRQLYLRQISSIKGAMADIDAKLKGQGGYVTPNESANNTAILDIDNQLRIANQKYINNNFRPQDKNSVDSLQRIKERLVGRSYNSGNLNPSLVRQELLNQRLKLEGDLASAQSALTTVENQLSAMPKTAGGANAAGSPAQNIIRDAEIASADYQAVQNQYNQAKLMNQTASTLALAEPGLPGLPEKSKNILYVGLSGISSLLVCLLGLFVIFALNTKVDNVARLEAITHQKVIGCLNYIESEDKDLRNIWKDNGTSKEYTVYKDLLRSLRFEINQLLSEDKNVLGITSLVDGAGKTFLAGSLSYAFAMMGKNVLLICEKDGNILELVTNTKNSDKRPLQKFESFLVKKQIQVEDRITILNRNTSKNNSLLELRDAKSLIAGFEVLKDTFDIVIIDIDSGEDLHNVKEWMMFCDRSIAVFEAGKKITENEEVFIKFLAEQKSFLGWILNKVKILNT
ncbi:MAG: Wzz/FepE/Etk N-terminal domain-containing protein [Niabella sp.]